MASSNKFAQPFKDYEILGRLGSGGMGTVFKARHRKTGEMVALKVLRPSLSRNDRHVERLRREAAFGLRFDHPNLVKIYGMYEEDGYHFLVMQYVEGKSLKSLLRTWGRFPEDQVIELGIQMASALAHSHGHGVIHRDVKPGNILIDEEGHAMLTDLGLAKGETDTTLTQDGSTVGTPQYMSPEQAQDPKSVGVEGDLYSLGATLFHMSVGQPPFDGDSIGQVITKLLHQKAESADSINPDVGAGLNLVLGRLLLKDPKLRYRSAEELLADLRLIESGHAPRVDPRILERDVILVDRPWYRQPVSLSLAGLLVALSILAFFVFPGDRDPIPRTLEELRPKIQAMADAGDYRNALRVLETARVDDEEVAAKKRYEGDLIETFDRRLKLFLDKKGGHEFRDWLQEHGLPDWKSSYLDAHVPEQIYATWRYTPDRLPEPLQRTWKAWHDRAQQSMALIVESEARDRVLKLAASYKKEVDPEVTRLVDEHRYREAQDIVDRYLIDPWQSPGSTEKRKPVLPRELGNLVDEFREDRRARIRSIRRMALSTLDTWKRDQSRLVTEVGQHTEALEFQVAHSKLDLLRKNCLDANLPWRSLPRDMDWRSANLGFQSDIKDLESDLARAQAQKLRNDAEEERERYLIKQDLAHDVLAKSLDLIEARRVLKGMRLVYAPAQKLRTECLAEIEELEDFLEWVYSLLEGKGASRKSQDWSILGSTRLRQFLVLDRNPPVLLHFAKEGSEVDKIPFSSLDRYPLVTKIQKVLAPKDWRQHMRGLGLYLFFGDEFEKAQLFLGDFDAELANRQQRRQGWLAEEKGDREQTLRERLLEVEAHLGKQDLGRAKIVLQHVRTRYAGSAALTRAEFSIRDLEKRIANLERKKALAKRLPISLQKAVLLAPEAPDLNSLGDATRVVAEIDLRRPEVFPKGYQEWRHSPLGLSWKNPDPGDEAKDWKRGLRFDIPLFERSQTLEHCFEIEIPPAAAPPVAIELSCSGTRLLFAQLPGQSVMVIPDPPTDLTAGLKAALKKRRQGDKQKTWFFLPGLRYEIRVSLGAVQAGRRSVVLEVDNRQILDDRTRVKERPQTKTGTGVRTLGPLVLSRFEVTGTIRS